MCLSSFYCHTNSSAVPFDTICCIDKVSDSQRALSYHLIPVLCIYAPMTGNNGLSIPTKTSPPSAVQQVCFLTLLK